VTTSHFTLEGIFITSVVHSVRASVTVTEAPASAANTEVTEDEETEDF
jgi:hypothetical protein